MKLIVGLGNPGILYINSRHNIGFMTVRALGRFHKIILKRDKGTFSLSGKGRISGENVLLALPLTFMNLSGNAVGLLVKKYKVSLRDLLVVCDDLDLELGRMKIKPAGSSAGQRGIKSIIETLGSSDFARLRIGIGRPPGKIDISRYVLSPFKNKEKEQLRTVIDDAASCCASWATGGITQTMSTFNVRSRRND